MTSELVRRIAFTLGALLVYRLGTYIPIPGIDSEGLATMFRAAARGPLGVANLASGGAVHRFAILALGILPYVSAAVVLQLASIALGRLRALQHQGERGRGTLETYTLCLTAVFAIVQAFGLALALESIPGGFVEPGWLFRLSTVATLAGGTIFLVWLSRQITVHGIGNGLALILAAGIVVELPSTIAGAMELNRQGYLSSNALVASLVIAIVVTTVIVFVERAQRRLPVEYAERQVGTRVISGRSHLVMKLNSAGIVPPLLASWLLSLLVAFASYGARFDAPWGRALAEQLRHGPLFMVLYALLIVLGAFFYTAFVCDPDQAADSLNKHGGTIPAIEPASSIADHLDHVVTRITTFGAAYLALVCLIPDLLVAYVGVPVYFGGTSLLIVVCTVMDMEAQIRGGHALSRGENVDEIDPAWSAGGGQRDSS